MSEKVNRRFLGSRTADSVRRQAQRELEQEKAMEDQFQRAVDLKEHYFGNRQVRPMVFSLFSIGDACLLVGQRRELSGS